MPRRGICRAENAQNSQPRGFRRQQTDQRKQLRSRKGNRTAYEGDDLCKAPKGEEHSEQHGVSKCSRLQSSLSQLRGGNSRRQGPRAPTAIKPDDGVDSRRRRDDGRVTEILIEKGAGAETARFNLMNNNRSFLPSAAFCLPGSPGRRRNTGRVRRSSCVGVETKQFGSGVASYPGSKALSRTMTSGLVCARGVSQRRTVRLSVWNVCT